MAYKESWTRFSHCVHHLDGEERAGCFVMLFLTVPRVCLQFVIVVKPDHTHILFLIALALYKGYFRQNVPGVI